MIDFLQGVLLVFGILAFANVCMAAWLIMWGTRRQKLLDAWLDGWVAANAGDRADTNPYLRPREQTHRG